MRVDQPVRLRVQWDQPGHRFVFKREDQAEVSVPYTVADTLPPGYPEKRLETIHWVANCGSPPVVNIMDATFEDVFVNALAVR